MTDAILGQRIFAYDDTDNLVSVTDARGETTTFLYDDLDRLVSRSDPIGKTRSFAYDARDNLISTTDPKLQTVTASYDDLSRLLSLTTPDNALGFTYDARGLLLTASDNDSALTFTYDALARLETAATTGGLGPQPAATLTNTYDILSNRTQIADTFGGQLSYGWDGADRLTGLTIGAGGPNIALGYDAAGRVTSVTHPNAVAMAATYDADGRLSELAHTLGAADLARFMYAYNAVGSITQIDEPSIQTRNFTYDLLQRLTAAGTAAAPESYTYDAEGNRLVSHLSASHTTDAANRLLEDDDFLYTYDDNGNVVTKTDKVTLGVTTYTYDAQDQL
jgi:YD repeat-containing protein